MKYLHSLQPPVIHSDLKCKNVLISENLVAKVSDCYSMLHLVHFTCVQAKSRFAGSRDALIFTVSPGTENNLVSDYKILDHVTAEGC